VINPSSTAMIFPFNLLRALNFIMAPSSYKKTITVPVGLVIVRSRINLKTKIRFLKNYYYVKWESYPTLL